jgi:hypothetical protein
MQCNGFVPEDVIPSFERGRDCYGACSAADDAVNNPSLPTKIPPFSDLYKFERCLLRPCTIAAAWSYVG